MTVNDQIRDEQLRYDINREAAKISALLSGKIHKYEYLTGEDILPCNQQQIIEQAKFTYSPLVKAFEKQIKTIENPGEKQMKAIEDQRQVKTIKKYSYDEEDTRFISKQKEVKLVDERLEQIADLDERVNSGDLIYRYKGKNDDIKFDEFDNALDIVNKIRDSKIKLEDVKYNQEKFKSNLGEINQKNQKTLCTTLKCFIMQEKRLFNFMIIILR